METRGGLPTRRQLLTGGVVLAVLLLGLWVLAAGRYVFISAGEDRLFRGDRWTGEILFVEADQSFPVKPAPP